jgi:hypothetical protein
VSPVRKRRVRFDELTTDLLRGRAQEYRDLAADAPTNRIREELYRIADGLERVAGEKRSADRFRRPRLSERTSDQLRGLARAYRDLAAGATADWTQDALNRFAMKLDLMATKSSGLIERQRKTVLEQLEQKERATMNQVIEPTREAALRRLIAQRAYEIWENQGRPQGCDLIHWREAEQEIMECVEQASDTSGAPEVPGDPARPEQQAAAQRQDELHETETTEDTSEGLHAVVQVSRSFFALVASSN